MDTTTLEDLDERHAATGYDVVQLVLEEASDSDDATRSTPIWIKPRATGLTDREGADAIMKVLQVTTGTRDGLETRLRALDFDTDGFVKPD